MPHRGKYVPQTQDYSDANRGYIDLLKESLVPRWSHFAISFIEWKSLYTSCASMLGMHYPVDSYTSNSNNNFVPPFPPPPRLSFIKSSNKSENLSLSYTERSRMSTLVNITSRHLQHEHSSLLKLLHICKLSNCSISSKTEGSESAQIA